MNPTLKEINAVYLQIQDYIEPPLGYFDEITEEELLEFGQKRTEYSSLYRSAVDKFVAIATNLSTEEVIEGYQQGCRLLQHNLCGHMYHHFDAAYIPLMLQAVQKDEHGAHLFLGSLAKHLGQEIAPLAISALDSKASLTRQAALSVVYQLELFEAIDRVRAMINDPDVETAHIAVRILRSWESK